MKLFTKDIDQKLFEQYPKGSDLNNQMVVAKIFNPYGRGTWYLLNSDPEDPDYIWAITDLFEIEVGSVSRTDLESIKFKPFMLGLERDLMFEPVNAMELYKGLQSGKQYAKGGGVKYYNKENEYRLSRPSSNIEKEILDRVTFKESMTNDMFVGSFGWKTPQGKIAEGYLYKLDDFDKNLIKNVSLKSGEKVFRYVNRATAIGGMMPFIKINLEKSLLYFLIHNENDDIIFETRGVNAMFINIIEDKMAHGGNTETSILLSTKSVQELVDKFNNAVFKGVGGIHEGKKYYEVQASKFAADGIKRELPSGYVLKNVGGDLYWIIQPSFVGKKASEIKRMADGGNIEAENAEMVKSYNKQIAHHTKEMTEAMNKNGEVPAWVVAKMTRSASDLSDATHYMEGKGEEFMRGGIMGDVYSIKDAEQFKQLITVYNELSEKFGVSNYFIDHNDNSVVFLMESNNNTTDLNRYVDSLHKRGFDIFEKTQDVSVKKDNSKNSKHYFKLNLSKKIEYANGGATPAQKRKVGKVMHEFKEGTLHSGKSGKVVKNPKQAVAIALSEAGLSKRKGWKHKK